MNLASRDFPSATRRIRVGWSRPVLPAGWRSNVPSRSRCFSDRAKLHQRSGCARLFGTRRGNFVGRSVLLDSAPRLFRSAVFQPELSRSRLRLLCLELVTTKLVTTKLVTTKLVTTKLETENSIWQKPLCWRAFRSNRQMRLQNAWPNRPSTHYRAESKAQRTQMEYGSGCRIRGSGCACLLESPSRAVRDRIDDIENEYPPYDSSAKFSTERSAKQRTQPIVVQRIAAQ